MHWHDLILFVVGFGVGIVLSALYFVAIVKALKAELAHARADFGAKIAEIAAKIAGK